MNKEKVRLRKKLRKKGLIYHHKINDGCVIYRSILAPCNGDGDGIRGYREVVGYELECSCKYWARVSHRSIRVKAERPIACDEQILSMSWTPGHGTPLLHLKGGVTVRTVISAY